MLPGSVPNAAPKDFLPKVAAASKPGMCSTACKLPKLNGTVVVLGAGDTAFDCATSALRCGARRVYVAFRKGIQGMRAVPEEVELAVDEHVEFLPFVQVSQCHTDEATGKVRMLEFARTYQDDDGTWHVDEEQSSCVKADHVISAFGSVPSLHTVQVPSDPADTVLHSAQDARLAVGSVPGSQRSHFPPDVGPR